MEKEPNAATEDPEIGLFEDDNEFEEFKINEGDQSGQQQNSQPIHEPSSCNQDAKGLKTEVDLNKTPRQKIRKRKQRPKIRITTPDSCTAKHATSYKATFKRNASNQRKVTQNNSNSHNADIEVATPQVTEKRRNVHKSVKEKTVRQVVARVLDFTPEKKYVPESSIISTPLHNEVKNERCGHVNEAVGVEDKNCERVSEASKQTLEGLAKPSRIKKLSTRNIRGILKRCKCLTSSIKMSPKIYKKKRTKTRRRKLNLFGLIFQVSLDSENLVNWGMKAQRSKRKRPLKFTRKKRRSQRVTGLRSSTSLAAFPVCKLLLGRPQAPDNVSLGGIHQTNARQVETMASLVSLETQNNGSTPLSIDGSQFSRCKDTLSNLEQKLGPPLINLEIQNDETEERDVKDVRAVGKSPENMIFHRPEICRDIVCAEATPFRFESHINGTTGIPIGSESFVNYEHWLQQHEFPVSFGQDQQVHKNLSVTTNGNSLEHQDIQLAVKSKGSSARQYLSCFRRCCSNQLNSKSWKCNHSTSSIATTQKILHEGALCMRFGTHRSLVSSIGGSLHHRPSSLSQEILASLHIENIQKMQSLNLNDRELDHDAQEHCCMPGMHEVSPKLTKKRKTKRQKLDVDSETQVPAKAPYCKLGILVPRPEPLEPLNKGGKKKQKMVSPGTQLMALNVNAQCSDYKHGILVPHASKRKLLTPKVDLDAETIREWEVVMKINGKGEEEVDETRAKWWEGEREVFHGRIELFIKRMHLLQGDRKFKPWKGSVVDSVVGVFLTQNVSDHLSSSAYMTMAATYPCKSSSIHETHREGQEMKNNEKFVRSNMEYGKLKAFSYNSSNQAYFVEEPSEVDENHDLMDNTDSMVCEDEGFSFVEVESGEGLQLSLPKELCSEESTTTSHDEAQESEYVGSAMDIEGRNRKLILEESGDEGLKKGINHANQRSSLEEFGDDLKGVRASVFLVDSQDHVRTSNCTSLDISRNLIEAEESRRLGCDESEESKFEGSKVGLKYGSLTASKESKTLACDGGNETAYEELKGGIKHGHQTSSLEELGRSPKDLCASMSQSDIQDLFETSHRNSLDISESLNASWESKTFSSDEGQRGYEGSNAEPEHRDKNLRSDESGNDLKNLCAFVSLSDSHDPFRTSNCSSTEISRSLTPNHERNSSTLRKACVCHTGADQCESPVECCLPMESKEKYATYKSSEACHFQEGATNKESPLIPENEPVCIGEKMVGSHNAKIQVAQDAPSVSMKRRKGKLANIKVEREGKVSSRQNKKNKEEIDWKSERRMYTKEGSRDSKHIDSVDWEAVRSAESTAVANSIKERGQHTVIARRIQNFLNQEVETFECVDLEWLRNAPPELVKKYLLEINGLGLKSVECVRLLSLQHVAFPVDTNVGRIAVRLGWVPLEPLPEATQIHLLEQYPYMDSIQKYLWPRLCTLDQQTLYELHYQMITFGKVFCTKKNPNCNSCPMKAECKHFASAFASARLALPGAGEKGMESMKASAIAVQNPPIVVKPTPVVPVKDDYFPEDRYEANNCIPIIEMPASPGNQSADSFEKENKGSCKNGDSFINGHCPRDGDCCNSDNFSHEIPPIELDIEDFNRNVQDFVCGNNIVPHSGDLSRALVALTPEAASIPMPKLKYYSRLRTEHLVYEIPERHDLLKGFEEREPDDPSPYLLAIWTPGETPDSFEIPKRTCDSSDSEFCTNNTCFFCNDIRERNSNIVRGTILIPCRTAMRGNFPLNGTYFQTNEVFADNKTSHQPIVVPRELIHKLKPRAAYFGSSTSAIFRGLSTRQIQLCFWTGFICVRAFDREARTPKSLSRRFHCPPNKKGKREVE